MIQVMATAIEKAQSTDPAAVASTIRDGMTVEGTTGTITYPEGGDKNPQVPVSVVTVKNGKFQSIAKLSLSDVPAP